MQYYVQACSFKANAACDHSCRSQRSNQFWIQSCRHLQAKPEEVQVKSEEVISYADALQAV